MNTIDLHVHTIASGHGINTLYEIVQEAEKKGVRAIAVTDHGPKAEGGPKNAYFYVLCLRVPKIINTIHIIKGIEANILDKRGKTDIPENLIPFFDLILAYMHPITSYKDLGKENNTKALLNAFEKNPCIDILAHPVTTWFSVDLKQVIKEACDRGIALELNESSFKYRDLDKKQVDIFIDQTMKYNGKFVIASDAHMATEVGTDKTVREIIRQYDIPESSILNKTLEDVFTFIQQRKSLKK